MTGERAQVLFVDDDPKAGELFQRFCTDCDFELSLFANAEDALAHFQSQGAEVIVTDLRMPGRDGLSLLEAVQSIDPDTAVIVITGYSTVDNAIQAMKLGAADFIKKPYDIDELIALVNRCLKTGRLRRENRLLKRRLQHEREHYGMIGKSPKLAQVQGVIEKIADVRCNVIIEGESGTGKELAARAIHELSQDADKPFIVIDCGAMTESLLESELFGHEKGAFTGAAHTRAGLFESASGGTVFLDEIGNISDAMQLKLLRVVQENQITRVGGVRPIDVDLRFIVASNRNLEQLVAESRFRHDLYHRLNVIKLTMPALRERLDDIPLLVQHFIDEFAQKYQRPARAFDAPAMQWLCGYEWPGNIRELKNLIERHVALSEDEVMSLNGAGHDAPPVAGTAVSQGDDWPTLKALEARYIDQVLERTGGNREQAAEILGINKSTLWRKLKT